MRRCSGVAAIIFATAAGCGGGKTFVDAGRGDANTIDGGVTIDATPVGDVTVTTYSRCCTDPAGTPVADIQVVSIQPDGSAGPSGTTDASGKVTLSGVLQGASITAIYPTGDGYHLVTTLGVRPGDDLVYGEQYIADLSPGTGGSLTLDLPAYAGAAHYYVFTPCGSFTFTAAGTLTVPENCTIATGDLILFAYDASYNTIATGVLKDVPFTDGASVTLAAWTPATAAFAATLTGLPADVNNVAIYAAAVYGDRDFYSSTYPTPDAGSASAMMSVPADSDRLASWAEVHRMAQVGRHEVYQGLAGDATSISLADPQLPWLGQLLVNSAAQIGTWVQIGDQPYDAAVGFVSWSRFDAVNDVTTSYDWTIEVPPGLTMWTWASPPAALADYLPATSDNISGDLQLVDLSGVDDYDAARAAPEWQWTCPLCATQSGELTGVSSAAFRWDGAEGFVTGAR
jgi:hypothetical protein